MTSQPEEMAAPLQKGGETVNPSEVKVVEKSEEEVPDRPMVSVEKNDSTEQARENVITAHIGEVDDPSAMTSAALPADNSTKRRVANPLDDVGEME